MGVIMHDAVIVTAFRKQDADAAHAMAVEFAVPVTPIVQSPVNDYYTFLICPDGSKEGWEDSEEGERRRAAWFKWSREHKDATFLSVVHVRYGDNPAYIVEENTQG